MEMDLTALSGMCECGHTHSLSVRGIWIGEGELSRLPGLVEENGWRKPVLLCDRNTWEIAGRSIAELLGNVCRSITLEPLNLHADEHGVDAARKGMSRDADVLIAAGSGTIHDITRFLAKERNIPFLSVPTAASVDGFVSTVAAMTWHGCKKTLPAVAPLYVLADSAIFAAAPLRLNASGVADLLGKFTALSDWRIASLVTGEYFCEYISRLEEQAMEAVCTSLNAIAAGERKGCEELMRGLLLSGLAMQMMGNSRPASGGEHHLSHLWEMEVVNSTLDAYHGEKVGVGLLLAARAYHAFKEELRGGKVKAVAYHGLNTEEIQAYFKKPGMLELMMEENTPDPLEAISPETLLAHRDEALEQLDKLPSEETLRGYLRAVGAPTTLEEIGLSESDRGTSLRLSPYVRNRLTLMRLMKRFTSLFLY